ncbi:MAG: RHS repeat protein, partial [Verrucomicrobiae bacterium]|nr:RHS repeat protein [Verrucomicrobiae bacterium]
FDQAFEVTLKASVKVANVEHPPVSEGDGYTYDYAAHELGEFTIGFEYAGEENPPSLPDVAKHQESELRGIAGNGEPEGDVYNGGQWSGPVESWRKIGVDGRPAGAAASFVDALTGRFHHQESDFALAVPGSDLVLGVSRSAADTTWTTSFGMRPEENPEWMFGPGWRTNLASVLVRTKDLKPDGSEKTADPEDPRIVKSSITLRDYRGGTFRFLEYTDGDGVTSYLADPTLRPDRANEGISLTEGAGATLVFSQPVLGLSHVYEPTTLAIKIPNNRDVATVDGTNDSGFRGMEYHRLASVTDRFGETLQYTYGADTAKLAPDEITVAGRTSLKLKFQQSGGRITGFQDPGGVIHTYVYASRTFNDGSTQFIHNVLASHEVGSRTAAAYDYHYRIEADPRPDEMLAEDELGGLYRIDTHHFVPDSITNGAGDELSVQFATSTARWTWSHVAGEYYHPAGDPLVVASTSLPNGIGISFGLDHTLRLGRPEIPPDGVNPGSPEVPTVYSIVTTVTDLWGGEWSYSFGTPVMHRWTLPILDERVLPGASALVFPGMSRSCSNVTGATLDFEFDAAAGFATSRITDGADRSTATERNEAFGGFSGPYTAPSLRPGTRIHSRSNLPSSVTDPMDRTTTWHYITNSGQPDHLLPSSIDVAGGRTLVIGRGVHARTESLRVDKAGGTLARVNFGYSGSIPGVVSKVTRKALGAPDDPSWTTDLVKDLQPDANGFPWRIGNDAAGINNLVTRDAAGRVTSVQGPDGGTRSVRYDDSGLVESICQPDGGIRSLERDGAGRVRIGRDPLGHATGIGYDPMGRPDLVVRDMNGNLDWSPSGGFEGVDPTVDTVVSVLFQDATRTVRVTDPRGYVSLRNFDVLGRTTRILTPGNDREPGETPDETEDRLTVIGHDLLESPNMPVRVTDPLGFETIYKFDAYGRLDGVLREYGENQGTPLYAGTFLGYDDALDLVDQIISVRTPLDSSGEPVGGASLQQLVTRIVLDGLGRPEESIHAEGSANENRVRVSRSSTGILWKREVRDEIGEGGAPDHWSAFETDFDALGRPTEARSPEMVDATTGLAGNATRNFSYDSFGRLEAVFDSYDAATRFGYDVMGRRVWRKSPSVLDSRSGSTRSPVSFVAYDAAGRMVRSVDPLGYAWSYEHDAAGRLKKATGPVVNPAAPAGHRRPVWERDYDLAGNLIEVTNPESRVTSYDYYPDNRLEKITKPVTFTNASGLPELSDVVERYERDARGSVTRVVDGEDQVTAFSYDGLGRLLTRTVDPDDSRALTSSNTYDALLLLTSEDAAGQVKQFSYDDRFLLEQIDVVGKPAESLVFGHDLLGNLTRIDPLVAPVDYSMGNPSVERTYDVLGLLRTETSNGVTTTYGYDLNGLLSLVSDDAGTASLSIQHDAAGRAWRVVDSGAGATLTTDFGHDLAGRLVHEEMPNGLVQES